MDYGGIIVRFQEEQNRFLFLQTVNMGSGVRLASYCVTRGILFWVAKQSKHEPEPSLPHTFQDKKEWSYTYTHPCTRVNQKVKVICELSK